MTNTSELSERTHAPRGRRYTPAWQGHDLLACTAHKKYTNGGGKNKKVYLYRVFLLVSLFVILTSSNLPHVDGSLSLNDACPCIAVPVVLLYFSLY